jgi:hypothetical protein
MMKRHCSGLARFHNGKYAKQNFKRAKVRNPILTRAHLQVSPAAMTWIHRRGAGNLARRRQLDPTAATKPVGVAATDQKQGLAAVGARVRRGRMSRAMARRGAKWLSSGASTRVQGSWGEGGDPSPMLLGCAIDGGAVDFLLVVEQKKQVRAPGLRANHYRKSKSEL